MCKSLKTVIFPASVETIEGGAFSYCSNLSDVYCYAENVPSLDNYSFYEVNLNNATLHVLAKSLTTYQGTDPWSQFGKIVPLTENEITGIELPNVDESLYNSKYIIYDIKGRRLETLQPGINIIRMSDGTTKKVVVK